eukprot:892142-Pleurochrysis_carterae.AAC.3
MREPSKAWRWQARPGEDRLANDDTVHSASRLQCMRHARAHAEYLPPQAALFLGAERGRQRRPQQNNDTPQNRGFRLPLFENGHDEADGEGG